MFIISETLIYTYLLRYKKVKNCNFEADADLFAVVIAPLRPGGLFSSSCENCRVRKLSHGWYRMRDENGILEWYSRRAYDNFRMRHSRESLTVLSRRRTMASPIETRLHGKVSRRRAIAHLNCSRYIREIYGKR